MDQSQSGDELLRRAALDYFSRDHGPRGGGERREQRVPVNVYDTGDDIVVVAPMPGVEADNIDIEVLGSTVTLRASLRGPGQERRQYLLHEWTYGPYERTIQLPTEVDGQSANASHDNGVLVVSLPKSTRARSVRIPLRQVTSSGAVHEGHSGHHSAREDLGSSPESE